MNLDGAAVPNYGKEDWDTVALELSIVIVLKIISTTMVSGKSVTH